MKLINIMLTIQYDETKVDPTDIELDIEDIFNLEKGADEINRNISIREIVAKSMCCDADIEGSNGFYKCRKCGRDI